MRIVIIAAALLLAGCGDPETGNGSDEVAEAVAARAAASPADVVVYKSPTCGCCEGWIDHLREAGYTVEAVDMPRYAELAATKEAAGVPGDLGSCHTAVVEGYTIEGHVPADVIARLLRERPEIKGLSVPGMPIGSPGMEGPNPEVYDVIAFTAEGERTVFERVDPRQPNSETR
jgi:hypothetical protein